MIESNEKPNLFLDISGILSFNSKGGIERVCKGLLNAFLKNNKLKCYQIYLHEKNKKPFYFYKSNYNTKKKI